MSESNFSDFSFKELCTIRNLVRLMLAPDGPSKVRRLQDMQARLTREIESRKADGEEEGYRDD